MPKITEKMPSFEGVAAGATATLRMPLIGTYETLYIAYTGVTLAQMEGIRVIADGKVIQRWKSGTALDQFNQFQGRAAASGVLCLDFIRYGLRTRAAQELTAIGTGVAPANGKRELSTFQLEIDIASAAIAPALSCKALLSPRRPLGVIRHVRPFTYTAGAVGEFEISDLPKGHLYNQVHLDDGSITSLRIEKNQYTIFDRTVADNELAQSDGVRTPQTDLVVYDPSEDGHGEEYLPTNDAYDLRIIPTVDASGTIEVVLDSIGVVV